jgi:phosphosulfolactate synthase
MEYIANTQWHPKLHDPIGMRNQKPRTNALTMIIDKGLGLRAYEDLLCIASPYIDMIKLGFGTSVLYPRDVLKQKIELAHEHNIKIMPGGTFLEVAIMQQQVDTFFQEMKNLKFSAIEVSDGTISLSRNLRSSLIVRGIDEGLTVVTEYGKKSKGSAVNTDELLETFVIDTELGAAFVTIESRESGVGVGIFDDQGVPREQDIEYVVQFIPDATKLMWEAPLKSQQALLLQRFGLDLNLGNISPEDVLSLESLRRGLRSDTLQFDYGHQIMNGKGE